MEARASLRGGLTALAGDTQVVGARAEANVGGGTEADAAAVREAVEALLLTRRDRVRVAFHRTVPRGEYGRASARRRLELDRAQAPTWRWVEAQMAGGLALRTSPCDKCGCYDIYPPLSNDLTAQREIRFRLVV